MKFDQEQVMKNAADRIDITKIPCRQVQDKKQENDANLDRNNTAINSIYHFPAINQATGKFKRD